MRLIDADALIQNIEWNRDDFKGRYPKMRFTVNDAIGCVNNAPTIEPKRGEWKLYGNDDDCGMSYWCTACNFHMNEDLFYSGYEGGKWIENKVFRFCPNCGAKMEVNPCG